MGEKRDCPLCGEPLEDAPAVHDVALCEKTELFKGRETIKKLKASVESWKEAWYHLRDIIGRMSWEHHNCPYEAKPAPEPTPNPWLHPDEHIVQEGKLVYSKLTVGYKLVGAGTSVEAGEAVARLMKMEKTNEGHPDSGTEGSVREREAGGSSPQPGVGSGDPPTDGGANQGVK